MSMSSYSLEHKKLRRIYILLYKHFTYGNGSYYGHRSFFSFCCYGGRDAFWTRI